MTFEVTELISPARNYVLRTLIQENSIASTDLQTLSRLRTAITNTVNKHTSTSDLKPCFCRVKY